MARTRRPARSGADVDGEVLSPGLVHELRQPLTGVDAGLKLVAREMGDSVTRLDAWKLATGQVARLVEVLETYQKLMAPGASAPAPFAADVVVRRVVAAERHRLDALRDGFAVIVEPGVPLAHGSPLALEHALRNLVTNALEAIEEGRRGGRIELRVRTAPGPAAQVRVSDDGPGIPASARRHLFSRRFTTKASGSGLGLVLSRRMIRGSGGEVRVVADDDHGRRPWARTEFAVDLAGGADAPAPRAADPGPAARWPRAAVALAGCAVAAAVVGLGWVAFQRWVRGEDGAVAAAVMPAAAAEVEATEVVEVIAATGTVERLRSGQWSPVTGRERLHEEDTIRTAADAGATIQVGERSHLALAGSTQLTVRELTAAVHRLRLARGRISVDHQPDGARVLVVESETGASVARAGPARFSVLASGAALAVATETGVVRLQAAGRTVEVSPGQQSVAFAGGAPAAPTAIPVTLLLEVARSAGLEDGTCGVQGRVEAGAEVRIAGRLVEPRPDGRFTARVPVARGTRQVTLVTRDAAGRTRERRIPCGRAADPADVSDFAVRWGQE
jgi:hypothetical protein